MRAVSRVSTAPRDASSHCHHATRISVWHEAAGDRTKEHPRWGWKTAHEILLREGWTINRKRTRRIWRQEGLRRPVRARKRRRQGDGQTARLRATKPNEVWAVDFQFDETSDLRRIKLCNIVDEYTREALAIRVERTCTAENVITIIEQLVAERGPQSISGLITARR